MTTKETCIDRFDAMLNERGVTRRRFLEFCGAIAVSLGLSEAMAPAVHEALAEGVIGKTEGNLAPVIWLELASCTGCTESLASAETPDVATIVLELISLNYAETLSAGAGFSLEAAKEETIEAGGYIVVIEGALMEGWDGNALKIANEKGTDIVRHAAHNAVAIVCAGSCAVDGGWQAALPNPGGAIGIQAFLEKSKADGSFTWALADGKQDIPPIINVPTCPSNPEHIIAVLVDVLLVGKLPALNELNMPSLIFNQYIHDNCPRRGHFENGEFVYQFGSVEESKGYCLYPMGCKGPQTKSNCPIVRWNRRVSWCVEAGAPCAGCANANPTKQGFNWVDLNTPFLKRFKNLMIGDIPIQPMTIGIGLTGLVAAALVVHAVGMKVTGRTKGGADFEAERAWDTKHPAEAIGPAAVSAEQAKANGKPQTLTEEVAERSEAAAAEEEESKSEATEPPAEENAKGGDE
ncbi:MAG: hydrogenase small subunit [Coriobacteriales bacterium]|jgi:hydrogenase small subunit|nr:hydrogenase small subunit [Coriobacteriales bacterium]